MIAVRCPSDLDPWMQKAGGLWEPGGRRWLIERRRIGPHRYKRPLRKRPGIQPPAVANPIRHLGERPSVHQRRPQIENADAQVVHRHLGMTRLAHRPPQHIGGHRVAMRGEQGGEQPGDGRADVHAGIPAEQPAVARIQGHIREGSTSHGARSSCTRPSKSWLRPWLVLRSSPRKGAAALPVGRRLMLFQHHLRLGHGRSVIDDKASSAGRSRPCDSVSLPAHQQWIRRGRALR
jgi:hypothetical protein